MAKISSVHTVLDGLVFSDVHSPRITLILPESGIKALVQSYLALGSLRDHRSGELLDL